MMKKCLSAILSVLTFLVIVMIFSFCTKIEKISEIPKIKFTEFTYKDSVGFNHILNGTLSFDFEDGDGNIGFGIDSVSKNTVFIKKYKITNGVPINIVLNENIVNYKIPVFSTSGNRKAIKGNICVKNLDEVFPINEGDTIMYKFFIKDRDNNNSNIDSTGYLILKNYIKE